MADSSSWSEQNGVWRRPLGSMESLYAALASPEGEPVHWMIGSCLSIEYHGDDGFDIERALQNSWRQVRHDLPNIGATVDRATGELVVEADDDEASLNTWLQKTFLTHRDVTADELFSDFKSQFCITLHYLPDLKQILIQAPHSILDGRGILYLYNALFTALSREPDMLTNGNDTTIPANLTASYDEWLRVPPAPSEKNAQVAQSIFQRILHQEKPIRIPGVDFSRRPRKAVHRDLELNDETTGAIIAACKKKGVSVTSALHAALAMKTQEIQLSAGEVATSFAQFTTIDLRRWFPSNFRQHVDSIGSLQTALPFVLDLGKDNTFDALSQSLHKEYKAPFSFAENDFGYLGPYMAMSRQIIENGKAPLSSTPYLSSLGVVDDYLRPQYGDWELRNFWISSTMLTGDNQMYLWTFRGKMVLSICYNEAFYATASVDALLRGTRDVMKQGLGVE